MSSSNYLMFSAGACAITSIYAAMGGFGEYSRVYAALGGGLAFTGGLLGIKVAIIEIAERAKPQTPRASPSTHKDTSPAQQHG